MWKQISDTKYEISSNGQVRNIKTKKELTLSENNGYLTTNIVINKQTKHISVHREVAKAFIPNDDPNKNVINHKNGIKTDNDYKNIEWCTQKENVNHALVSGLTGLHAKPIIQMDLNGVEIRRYKSIKEMEDNCEKDYGKKFDRSRIIRICKNEGKTAYGYRWKYVEEFKQEIEPEGKTYEEFDNYIFTKDKRVWSKKSKKYLKPIENEKGYYYVTLMKNKKRKNVYINAMYNLLFGKNEPI